MIAHLHADGADGDPAALPRPLWYNPITARRREQNLTADALSRIEARVAGSEAALLYATTSGCGVCVALKPKVRNLLASRFPRMAFIEVELDAIPELGRHYNLAAVPTVIVFFEGKEHFRKTRVFGLEELADAIGRPYRLLFDA